MLKTVWWCWCHHSAVSPCLKSGPVAAPIFLPTQNAICGVADGSTLAPIGE